MLQYTELEFLKVHKIEIFLDSEFEFCTISLLLCLNIKIL